MTLKQERTCTSRLAERNQHPMVIKSVLSRLKTIDL